jgi:hypothetical protein
VKTRRGGEGEGGNREVSPIDLFDIRGDLSGAEVEANISGRRGFMGETWFPRCDRAEGEGGRAMVAAGRKAA